VGDRNDTGSRNKGFERLKCSKIQVLIDDRKLRRRGDGYAELEKRC
jgi:hypothetical protein